MKTVWILLSILLLATSVLADEPWSYADQSGWQIIWLKPADELRRVQKFEDAACRNDICSKAILNSKAFQIMKEMRRTNYVGWYAFALDVPYNHFLMFDKRSKFIMIATNRADTILVDSQKIVFARGWGGKGFNSFRNQCSPIDNTEKIIQIRCSDDPGFRDFEWVRLKEDKDKSFAPYYVMGYVYFDKDEMRGLKVHDFRILNVQLYERR